MARQAYEYPVWIPAKNSSSQPSRSSINSTKNDRDASVTVAADGSPIGVVYGRTTVAPMVYAAVQESKQLYLGLAWCMGEIDAVESMFSADDAMNTSYISANYVGSTTQPVDPTLAGVIDGYTDDLVGESLGEEYGVAHSVLSMPINTDFSFDIKAIVRGALVRDPRSGLVQYSNNAALCLAHFLESASIGLGTPVNDDSLIDAADYCDELMEDGNPRHTVNLSFLGQYKVDSIISTLKAYSNCLVFKEGSELRLVPQRPTAVSGSVIESDMVSGTIEIEQTSTAEQPTVITVEYTDITVWPWAPTKISVKHPDIASGSIPWRESRISMTGLQSRSEAARFGVQRLNHATLINLHASALTFDESLEIQGGDIVSVSHSWGLTQKQMRVVGVSAAGPGRWQLGFEEYSASVYSDIVEPDPAWPDTGLPAPQNVPPIEGLVATEVLSQSDKGFWQSTLDIRWEDISDTYVFPHEFRVVIEALPNEGTTRRPIAEIITDGYVAASPPVQEKIWYVVSVRAESRWGDQVYVGEASVVQVLAQGKFLPPTDVPSIRVLEAGGQCYINWEEANDIDIWRYELRYAQVGGAWADAVLIDRLDAVQLTTDKVPAGDWDILIKAIDSVANESENAARATVTVTIDDSVASGAAYDYQSASQLTNMVPVQSAGMLCWVTSDGATWDSVFTAALDTYTAIVASYTAATDSSWQSETYDWGRAISGDWAMPDFDASLIGGGSPVRDMQLRDALSDWNSFTGLAAKGAYDASRAYASAGIGQAMVVCIPSIRVEISSAPRTQSGKNVSSAATPRTITLNYVVHAITSIQVTPTGNGASSRTGVVDNIVIGDPSTFDVYVFDSAGAQVTSEFYWEFRGI